MEDWWTVLSRTERAELCRELTFHTIDGELKPIDTTTPGKMFVVIRCARSYWCETQLLVQCVFASSPPSQLAVLRLSLRSALADGTLTTPTRQWQGALPAQGAVQAERAADTRR
jgi:hypothetical protein